MDNYVVEGPGTNHLRRLKQVVQLGVATAGIQRPLVFPYLPNHPLGKIPSPAAHRPSRLGYADRSKELVHIKGSATRSLQSVKKVAERHFFEFSHSVLAPTARPAPHAGKALLRKRLLRICRTCRQIRIKP